MEILEGIFRKKAPVAAVIQQTFLEEGMESIINKLV